MASGRGSLWRRVPLCSSFAHREAHSPEIAAAVTQTLSSSMDYDTDYGRVPRQGAHRYIVVNSPFTEITVKVTVNHRRSRYYQVHSTEASVHKVSMNETSTAYTEAPLSSFLHRLRRYTVKLCHRLHRLGIGHAYTVLSRLRLRRHRIVPRFVTAVIAAGLVLASSDQRRGSHVADTSQRFCMSTCWPHALRKVAPSPSLCAPGPAYDFY